MTWEHPTTSDGYPVVDLQNLGFDEGAHLLVGRALARVPPGGEIAVLGYRPDLTTGLAAWCRREGCEFRLPGPSDARDGRPSDAQGGRPGGTARAWVRPGRRVADRWSGAERAGGAAPDGVAARPPGHWGLAARGALVEAGGPETAFDFADRDVVWSELAPSLYAHAAAAQWDPATAIPWDSPFTLPDAVEQAVVQIMTYLVENEQAALIIPARLLARVHPHFREVLQLLAVQAADEARHVEVFTRRALLKNGRMGTSSVGGRASLTTLLAEPDYSLASFLLSVLGEGSFLNLLAFLDRHAPDPVTRRVVQLARQDEARHVAFGIAHLQHQATVDPGLRHRLRAAVERRHDALADTAGLNQDVTDALIVMAAGEWTPRAIARGHREVLRLQAEMDEGRRRRLVHLGFPHREAADLSALHTRNFM
ncbi:ferritin-like domain-containing protein [Streptomyces sp. 35G-GA-8]|uniref:ferritin-like domain-containing protein n=1 Tax=Streptomyces sp. 35G-GA-8 TaxID=2939434 RepID=UPI00201E8B80|nr:ferritin-like domain-containing protein [Streptomyces sp. 35G-GA-8]MCL7380036.1 ferritin-like domain-containing protein [Streptomyces sp. 35G-GA-8]